jgi:hypothetical protein
MQSSASLTGRSLLPSAAVIVTASSTSGLHPLSSASPSRAWPTTDAEPTVIPVPLPLNFSRGGACVKSRLKVPENDTSSVVVSALAAGAASGTATAQSAPTSSALRLFLSGTLDMAAPESRSADDERTSRAVVPVVGWPSVPLGGRCAPVPALRSMAARVTRHRTAAQDERNTSGRHGPVRVAGWLLLTTVRARLLCCGASRLDDRARRPN